MKRKELKRIPDEKKMPGRNGSWVETDFSIKVKKKLIDKRMTQKQLGQILGVSSGYISQNIYGHKNDEGLKEKIRMVLDIKVPRKMVSGE